jgi:hypothetical protein
VRASISTSRGGKTDFDIPGRALLVQLPKPASGEALLQEIRAEPYPLIEKVQVNGSEIWNFLQLRAAFEKRRLSRQAAIHKSSSPGELCPHP